MENLEERVDEPLSQILSGDVDVDNTELFDQWMLFQIKNPDAAAELKEFRQLMKERGQVSSQIRDLESKRDQLDSQIQNLAEELQEKLYNV